MNCSSNSDCEFLPTKPVCKESISDELKTCQSRDACSVECENNKFCSAENECKPGTKPEGDHLKSEALNIFVFPVLCNTNADCSNQEADTVCEVSPKSGKNTCIEPTSSSCKEDCGEGKYCNGENVCKNGKVC